MESRWYLPPGKTLESTRIEDRGHALHVTANAWEKITAHLDRKKLMQEAIDKEEAHRIAMKKGSEAMTKSWDNSLENIRIRKEQERLDKLEKAEEEKMRNFYALRKEQEAVKAKFVEDAKKSMYISKGYPKELTGALIESGVLYERGKQLEMKDFLLKQQKEDEAKYAEEVKKGARQEMLENLEKEKQKLHKTLEIRALYLKDMHDRAEVERLARETRIQNEMQDNINATKENKQIERILKEEDQRRREEAKEELKKFNKQQEDFAKLKARETEETEAVIDIYSKAKQKIQCMRLKKEAEMKRAQQLRAEAAAKTVVADAQSKADTEERIMRKALAERDQEEMEKFQAKEEQRKKLIKERQDNYEAYLQQEAHRKQVEKEVEKWQMLNRLKTNDVITKYELDKKQKAFDEKIAYREILFGQIEENEKEKRRIKDIEDAIYREEINKFAKEDDKFAGYAKEVQKYAEDNHWNQLPIRKVIKAYRKENNLPITSCYPCENYVIRPQMGTENKYPHRK